MPHPRGNGPGYAKSDPEKLHDLATHELNRYLNAAIRHLIQSIETFWDRYAVSSCALENERPKPSSRSMSF